MPPVNLALAFLAGVLTFLSPCLLPLVPAYLGYLSGSGVTGGRPFDRWRTLAHAASFLGGFSLLLIVLLGLPTLLLSDLLAQYNTWISRIGGVILLLFGLHTVGLLRFSFLETTRRFELRVGEKPGYLRSVLVGMTFAAGWTPCAGPLLGTVLTLAFTEPTRAVGLLAVYALGLSGPFLLTAALLSQALAWLKRFRALRAVQIGSGVLMIAVGLLLLVGRFATMSRFLIRFTPDWLLKWL